MSLHSWQRKEGKIDTISNWHTRKTIIYCFCCCLKKRKRKKREKAYTHWVQQIKSPKVILKQPYLEYRVSDFVCVIFFLYNSTFESTSNWHFYKLCKNLFNTRGEKKPKTQKSCMGHLKKNKKYRNNMMWISCYPLYYCTQYTNWFFVSFYSHLPSYSG